MDVDYDNSEEVMNLLVKRQEMPQSIYKYASLETAKLILGSSKLKFSKPSEFNDPFDCNITVNTDNSYEEIESYIHGLISEGKLKEERVKEFEEKLCDPDYRFELTNKSIKEAKEAFGITCFSQNSNNLLMWAHYANMHRGIAIKFDILNDPDLFMTPYHVKYSDKYPEYNYIRDKNSAATCLLETKSLDWKYEEEIRIMKQGANLYAMNQNAISEIIFGCRMTKNEMQNFISFAKDKGWNNIIYKTSKLKALEFGLDFHEYAD